MNKDTSKQWFETGDYPTQDQFAQVFDWVRWKDEGISIADVANLQSFLNTIQATVNSIIPNKIINGGLVTIKSDDGTNVVLQIPDTFYSLKGIEYTIGHSEVTIVRPVDDTKSRFDVFYLDPTGFHVLTGEETESPVKPQLLSGMELTTILIGFDNDLIIGPTPGTPNLQAVTLAGNKTTLPLISKHSLQAGQAATDVTGAIKVDALSASRIYQLPDKAGTFAMLDDVTGAGAVIDDSVPSLVKVYSSQKTEDITATKVDKITGKGLSTEDYTTLEKIKLSGIAAGAQVNDANTTLQGNTFNGADQLVKLDASAKLPAVDGSLLTNLPTGGGGGVVWGGITGTLPAQNDLITYITGVVANGNTAFGWGNHASAGYLTSASSLAWAKVAGRPTTLAGYGITDGYALPSQAGNAGKWLTTNGTTESWAANNGWSTTGNDLTDPAVNFFGTKDNQPLIFRTNNINRMRLLTDGSIEAGEIDGLVNQKSISLRTDGIRWLQVGTGTYGGTLKFSSSFGGALMLRNSADIGYVNMVAAKLYTTLISSGINSQYESLTIQSNLYPGNVSESTIFSNSYGSGGGKRMIIYSTNGPVSILPTTGNLIVGDYYTGDVTRSKLTVISTTQGSIPAPRMTTTQREAIAVTSSDEGLEVFDVTLHKKCVYNGTAWETGQTIGTTTVSGTTYTLLSSDSNKQLLFTNAAAITITVPAGLPVGFVCSIVQQGDGQISIVNDGTTTINNRQGQSKTAGRYAVLGLQSVATNSFILSGDTTA